MSDTQTVNAESDTPAEPESEDKVAQDNLDTLLDEWKEPEVEKSTPEPDDRIGKLEKELAAERTARLNADSARQVSELVGNLKSDAGSIVSKLSDRMVRSFLETRAQENPKLAEAFVNRQSSPTEWSKMQDALKVELESEFSGIVDAGVAQDQADAAAAVRGMSNRPPTEPEKSTSEIQNMNDAEWAAHKRAVIGG